MPDTALRIYFPHHRKVPSTSLMGRLFAPGLGRAIVLAAHKSGISQTIGYRVSAGYLAGEKISSDHAEITPHGHPECVELLDTEKKLRAFVQENRELLVGTNVVYLTATLESETANERH